MALADSNGIWSPTIHNGMATQKAQAMNHAEQLREARNLIDKPEKWSGAKYNDHGRITAEQALSEACAINCWSYLERAMGEDIVQFNDTHTHAEVLAAFDRAIKLAEQES